MSVDPATRPIAPTRRRCSMLRPRCRLAGLPWISRRPQAINTESAEACRACCASRACETGRTQRRPRPDPAQSLRRKCDATGEASPKATRTRDWEVSPAEPAAGTGSHTVATAVRRPRIRFAIGSLPWRCRPTDLRCEISSNAIDASRHRTSAPRAREPSRDPGSSRQRRPRPRTIAFTRKATAEQSRLSTRWWHSCGPRGATQPL